MTFETTEWLRYPEAQNQIFPDTARSCLSIHLYAFIVSSLVAVRMLRAMPALNGGNRILRTVFGVSIQPKGAKKGATER